MADHSAVTPGSLVRVRYDPDCPGYRGHPHHPAEEGARVKITTVNEDLGEGHCIRGNYQGAPWRPWDTPDSEGGLGVGRSFRPDELEILPADHIDPSHEDEADRRAELRRRVGLAHG
jgi:hypothetical protein